MSMWRLTFSQVKNSEKRDQYRHGPEDDPGGDE